MRRNNAFTLVELLVVIGIISVLVAILLPALNKARDQAKTVVCASNMRQIALAARMYAAQNKGQLPYAFNWGTTGSNDPVRRYTFFSLIAPDLGLHYAPDNWKDSQYYTQSVFKCPSDDHPRNPAYEKYKEGGDCSYSVNGNVSDIYDPSGPGGVSIFGTGKNAGAKKLTQILLPSTTLLIVESQGIVSSAGYYNACNWGFGGQGIVKRESVTASYAYSAPKALMSQDEAKQGFHNRSYGRGVNNWAFVDGHVETMNWVQTIQPRNLWQVDPDKQSQAYDPGNPLYLHN